MKNKLTPSSANAEDDPRVPSTTDLKRLFIYAFNGCKVDARAGLIAVLFLCISILVCIQLYMVRGQTLPLIESTWLKSPIMIDGYLIDDAWDDVKSAFLTIVYEEEMDIIELDAWIMAVNDNDYVYFYGIVEFPEEYKSENDLIQITYLWGDIDAYGEYEYGDFLQLSVDTARTWDYIWDNEDSVYIEDFEFRTSGTNDIQGVAYHDGDDYVFEIRKPLNSGDGCDWIFEPGELYGVGDDWFGLRLWSSMLEVGFIGQFSISLAKAAIIPRPKLSLELIIGILSVIGAIIGIYFKIRTPLKDRKRKDVYNIELIKEIDDAIKNVEKLEKLKLQITNDFKEELIEPDDYQKLITKINDYIVMIERARA